jgi:TPR repeat protein
MIKIISAAILGLLLVSCGPPQDGHGTREYNNGTYVGEWKDGNMHGQGTFTSTKGTQYVGAWKHGKMHGEGTYTFASGNQYRGKWKNDSQWTGKEYDKDGNILSTITNGSNLLAVIEENVTNRLASGGADYDKGMAAYKSGDYSTALRYMRPLAEQGNADAQHNLGVMYGDGDGVPQDDKTTLKWWTLAAEQGDADAQLNLGGMYGKGRGVLQDNIYAHMWVHIAASSGDTDASSYRDEIAKEMTPAQIEKAEKLARECVAKKYKGC